MTKCNKTKYAYCLDTLLVGIFLSNGILGIMLLVHVMDKGMLESVLCSNLKQRLLLLVLLPTLVCLLSTMKTRRSSENAFANAIIPYCCFLPGILHFVLTEYGLFLVASLAISALCAGLWIKKNKQLHYMFYDALRLFLVFHAVLQLLCFAVAFLSIAIRQSKIFCISLCSLMLIGSSFWIVERYIYSFRSKAKTEGSMMFLRKEQLKAIHHIGYDLKTNPWFMRSADEKRLLVCQIAEIESGYLGIKFCPKIKFTDCLNNHKRLFPFQKRIGAYQTDIDQICLDHSLLKKNSPYSILECLFHELHHAYQARLTSLLPLIPNEYRDLLSVRQIEQIEFEFDHYISDVETDAYRKQLCEQTAECYAQEALNEYMLLLEQ